MKVISRVLSIGLASLTLGGTAIAAQWYPYKAEEVTPAFSPDGKVSPVDMFRSRRPPSPGRSVSLSRT